MGRFSSGLKNELELSIGVRAFEVLHYTLRKHAYSSILKILQP